MLLLISVDGLVAPGIREIIITEKLLLCETNKPQGIRHTGRNITCGLLNSRAGKNLGFLEFF